MCAPAVDHLVGQTQVVVERVEVLGRVEQVAGVAERDLGDGGAGREHGLDGGPQLIDVVEGVEDAEDVDAGRRGLGHEGIRDRGRVRRVADRVAAAQQHLDGDVRQRLAHGGEPLPRVLAEEAEGDVVGRAAPGLDAEQAGGEPGDVRQHRDEILGAHARGEQRLVRVAERRVGDREGGLRAERGGEAGGTELEQALARPVGRRAARGRPPGSFSAGSSAPSPSPLGWLTVTSASQFRIFVPRSFDW